MKANIDIFSFGLDYMALCHTYRTGIAQKSGSLSKLKPKSLSGYHPQKQGVAANNSNIFGLGSGLGYTRLFARGLGNQRQIEKLTGTRSELTI